MKNKNTLAAFALATGLLVTACSLTPDVGAFAAPSVSNSNNFQIKKLKSGKFQISIDLADKYTGKTVEIRIGGVLFGKVKLTKKGKATFSTAKKIQTGKSLALKIGTTNVLKKSISKIEGVVAPTPTPTPTPTEQQPSNNSNSNNTQVISGLDVTLTSEGIAQVSANSGTVVLARVGDNLVFTPQSGSPIEHPASQVNSIQVGSQTKLSMTAAEAHNLVPVRGLGSVILDGSQHVPVTLDVNGNPVSDTSGYQVDGVTYLAHIESPIEWASRSFELLAHEQLVLTPAQSNGLLAYGSGAVAIVGEFDQVAQRSTTTIFQDLDWSGIEAQLWVDRLVLEQDAILKLTPMQASFRSITGAGSVLLDGDVLYLDGGFETTDLTSVEVETNWVDATPNIDAGAYLQLRASQAHNLQLAGSGTVTIFGDDLITVDNGYRRVGGYIVDSVSDLTGITANVIFAALSIATNAQLGLRIDQANNLSLRGTGTVTIEGNLVHNPNNGGITSVNLAFISANLDLPETISIGQDTALLMQAGHANNLVVSGPGALVLHGDNPAYDLSYDGSSEFGSDVITTSDLRGITSSLIFAFDSLGEGSQITITSQQAKLISENYNPNVFGSGSILIIGTPAFDPIEKEDGILTAVGEWSFDASNGGTLTFLTSTDAPAVNFVYFDATEAVAQDGNILLLRIAQPQ